jgi:hypothetical protein
MRLRILPIRCDIPPSVTHPGVTTQTRPPPRPPTTVPFTARPLPGKVGALLTP